MSEIIQTKLRNIGSSMGVLLPKEELNAIGAEVGDEIEIAILKHKDEKEVDKWFGSAKNFRVAFERDKKTREF